MFYARVLSGYEEHRIRSYRLQIQQRLAKVYIFPVNSLYLNLCVAFHVCSWVRPTEELFTSYKRKEEKQDILTDFSGNYM